VRNRETARVITRHIAETSCDDSDRGVVEDMVRAHVYWVLGAWLQGDGSVDIKHDCENTGKKRDSSSVITSDIFLDGINAVYQASLLQENLPTNGTGNGVAVTLDSADVDESSGLSGGAIAGIIIGSIVGFILVIVIVYVVVAKQGKGVDVV